MVRRGPWWTAVGLLCAGLLGLARGEAPSLARVGARSLDAGLLLARLARLLPEQRARFGASWPEQRRQFLERELIPEALLEQGAARDDRRLGSPRDLALSRALQSGLEQQAALTSVSDAEVAEYYGQHRARYEAPRSISIWRILVRQEADARALLRELGQPSESTWSRLARERSIDTATHMRSGSLGFVAADGQTHLPQVRVSPALFAAAERVRDGELVPEPVAEGDAFAVVWRRASRSAQASQIGAVAADIRGLLVHARQVSELQALTERLRKDALHDYQPGLLAGFEPRVSEALEPGQPAPPSPLPARPVSLSPRRTDSGLR
ncbi:MAG TPA: peptidyl-prolyl cis-trans isomerase [Polyangiaceae bacterium]|nr:peptidyl-prolyl cis-trans isomerase [Polyangiaceae bacterium]